MINNKFENQTCGDSPSIAAVFEEDSILINLKSRLKNILEMNLNMLQKYCDHFAHIYKFYNEDMNFDEKLIKENLKCDVFRDLCERYRNETEQINSIVDSQCFGIFYLEFQRFKSIALSALTIKQEILAQVMPEYVFNLILVD
jgi:hypothetical protein